eukprot:403345954
MNQNNNNRKQQNQQDYQEGVFERVTRPVGRPKPNLDKTPYEKWNWQQNDPDFYESFHRLPDSKIPEIFNQVRWNRYNQSIYAAQPPKRLDFRPRTLWTKMRLEVILFSSSILLGLMLPSIIRWGNKRRMDKEADQQQRLYMQQNSQPMAVRVNQNLRNIYSEANMNQDPKFIQEEDQARQDFAERVGLLSQDERDKRELVQGKNIHGLGSGYFKT